MNIREAKEKYRQEKEKCIDPEFRSMAEVLVDARIETNQPIKNSNYLHALYLTELMFEHTGKSINILSGAGLDGFLESIQESFIDAIKRISNAGGKVRMILLGHEAPPFINQLKAKYKSSFDIWHATEAEGQHVRHFIVCDRNKVRVEDIHNELTDSSDINDIRADVFMNNRSMAKVFNTFFNTCLEG